MRPVATAAEVRAWDAAAIEGLGLPGVALMEVASRAVAVALRSRFPEQARAGVVVVCGPGNNGGDGWGVARWLLGWGLPVSVWPVAEPRTADAACMAAVARAAGVPEVHALGRPALVVDALLGTGLSRAPSGAIAAAIEAINAWGAPVAAIDLPSGLASDTGAAAGAVVRAQLTVTLASLKVGLLCEPGASLAGEVEVADIGLGVVARPTSAYLLEASDLQGRWPRRAAADHKGRSGHLAVVAGSAAQAGAAILCCAGALAGGAGLVSLIAPAGAAPRLAALPPEVMVRFVGEGSRLERLPVYALQGATAGVAGPGLAGGEGVLAPGLAADLARLWAEDARPWLFDADALAVPRSLAGAPRVLSPHPGEAARALGLSVAEVEADRIAAARALAAEGAAVLLKGRHTLVHAPGAALSFNPTGASTLATGGSGDVLAGLIGALLARGTPPVLAAQLGAWAHGRAGEILAARHGGAGVRASDIAAALPAAIAELA